VRQSRILTELGLADRAWPINAAHEVLSLLHGRRVAILGGDVYMDTAGGAAFTADNWHSDPRLGEPFATFSRRSIVEAEKYLTTYPQVPGVSLLVGLVAVTEDELP
jgi:hypothetical protein